MSKISFKEAFCKLAYPEGDILLNTELHGDILKYKVARWGCQDLSEWYVDPLQAWSEAFNEIVESVPRVLYADSTSFEHEMGETARSKYTLHDNKERCVEDHKCMQGEDNEGYKCYPIEVVVLRKEFFDKLIELVKEN